MLGTKRDVKCISSITMRENKIYSWDWIIASVKRTNLYYYILFFYSTFILGWIFKRRCNYTLLLTGFHLNPNTRILNYNRLLLLFPLPIVGNFYSAIAAHQCDSIHSFDFIVFLFFSIFFPIHFVVISAVHCAQGIDMMFRLFI